LASHFGNWAKILKHYFVESHWLPKSVILQQALGRAFEEALSLNDE